MPLPDNIPPLHTQMEYASAKRSAGLMHNELRSTNYKGDRAKQTKELAGLRLRIIDYKQTHLSTGQTIKLLDLL